MKVGQIKVRFGLDEFMLGKLIIYVHCSRVSI